MQGWLLAVVLAAVLDTSSPFTNYSTEVLAPGVFAFVAPDDESGIVNSNTLLVVGDDAALVVDTGQFPSLTRRQIAEIRRITPVPVRYVVTTHWHGDHHMGNVAYREAFPDAVFLAHEETRRLELKNGLKELAEATDSARKQIAAVEALLAHGKGRSGAPLRADQRRHLDAFLADMRLYPAEVDAATFVPSSVTFRDGVTIQLGRREVRVMHLGRGNTAGDAVVYVPDAKVLAAGDLLVAPTPFAFGSYVREWPRTLDALTAIDATTIVPGHGPVMHDFTYARRVRDALVRIDSQVRDAVAKGKTLEQVQASVKLDAVATGFAARGDAYRVDALANAFVAPAVDRAFQEAQGQLADEE